MNKRKNSRIGFSRLAKFNLHFHTSPDAGTGGGGGNNSGESSNSEGGNNNNSEGDNNKQPVESFQNLWDTTDSHGDTSSQNSEQNSGENSTGFKDIHEYMDSLNFTDGLDFSNMQEMSAEDFDSRMKENFSKIAQNSYIAALRDADQINNSRLSQSQQQTQQEVDSRSAFRELAKEHPYTQDKAIKPIAELVLSKLREQGVDTGSAIGKVNEFFNYMSTKTGHVQSPNQNSNNRNVRNSGKEIDWLDLLGGKSST